MLTQWKINRYRQNLAEEMRRRNNGGLLDSAFDRHWVEHMIGIAIRSNQSPAALASQLSRLADFVIGSPAGRVFVVGRDARGIPQSPSQKRPPASYFRLL
jgi:hypothetical protein